MFQSLRIPTPSLSLSVSVRIQARQSSTKRKILATAVTGVHPVVVDHLSKTVLNVGQIFTGKVQTQRRGEENVVTFEIED
jgi:hypothetical protein